MAIESRLNVFIHLYYPIMSFSMISRIKRFVGRFFLGKIYIQKNIYDSELITHEQLSPEEFRELIYSSDCIIDTYNTFQEGMTPRFMWALGAGKKIITTNFNAKNYNFYSDDQIYILNERVDSLQEFLKKEIDVNKNKHIIENYRIDNWIKTILS